MSRKKNDLMMIIYKVVMRSKISGGTFRTLSAKNVMSKTSIITNAMVPKISWSD
jgi:hypothetical protein